MNQETRTRVYCVLECFRCTMKALEALTTEEALAIYESTQADDFLLYALLSAHLGLMEATLPSVRLDLESRKAHIRRQDALLLSLRGERGPLRPAELEAADEQEARRADEAREAAWEEEPS